MRSEGFAGTYWIPTAQRVFTDMSTCCSEHIRPSMSDEAIVKPGFLPWFFFLNKFPNHALIDTFINHICAGVHTYRICGCTQAQKDHHDPQICFLKTASNQLVHSDVHLVDFSPDQCFFVFFFLADNTAQFWSVYQNSCEK